MKISDIQSIKRLGGAKIPLNCNYRIDVLILLHKYLNHHICNN